jgi:hypothetical protein
MRQSWPFALAVIVVGGLAGLAIAGRPEAIDPFVLDPGATLGVSTSSVAASTTTSTSEPATTTTNAVTTTTPATTEAATTTEAPTTTEVPTTTVIAGPLPRDQVRLVIANGDGRFRLASVTADRIQPLGYIIDLGDTTLRVDATVLYYRPDFDDEAVFAATDIGLPDAIILPFPLNLSQPITDSDDRGDIIIVLGPDAPR